MSQDLMKFLDEMDATRDVRLMGRVEEWREWWNEYMEEMEVGYDD